ncbi:MAG: cupin domain-containing protein [Halobellus sp.]|uniref:cupin domain-containing protein n=1 Tax=Halobellus sp. TaxID=1979212 RepID=UPI0035D4415F
MPQIEHLHALEAAPHANVFTEHEPKTVKLELDADERVPEHDHPGREVVLCPLDGAIRLELDGEPHALETGDVARFDGAQGIAQIAEAPSTALLVLAKKPTETRGQ